MALKSFQETHPTQLQWAVPGAEGRVELGVREAG